MITIFSFMYYFECFKNVSQHAQGPTFTAKYLEIPIKTGSNCLLHFNQLLHICMLHALAHALYVFFPVQNYISDIRNNLKPSFTTGQAYDWSQTTIFRDERRNQILTCRGVLLVAIYHIGEAFSVEESIAEHIISSLVYWIFRAESESIWSSWEVQKVWIHLRWMEIYNPKSLYFSKLNNGKPKLCFKMKIDSVK